MAYVNYVRENIAFIEYASDEGVTANERLLWYALFHIMNKRAVGSDWPDELVSISNSRLLSLVPFGEDSLVKARNRLAQRGLIRYEAGKKNTASPKYAINYFCSELSTNHAQSVGAYPTKSGNTRGNMPGNMGGNMPGNVPGNVGGLYINYNPNGIHNPDVPQTAFEDDDATAAANGRAREWEEWANALTKAAFLSAFGREATPVELNALVATMRVVPEQASIMPCALRAAARNGARNPIPYARAVYSDYAYYRLQTDDEVEEFEIMQTVRNGTGYERSMYEDLHEKLEKRRREREGLPVDDKEYEAYLRGEGANDSQG